LNWKDPPLQLSDAPLAIIDKRRSAHNVAEVMNLIGDVEGKVAVMIDDMIDTGGTLAGGAKLLKDKVQLGLLLVKPEGCWEAFCGTGLGSASAGFGSPFKRAKIAGFFSAGAGLSPASTGPNWPFNVLQDEGIRD
jgi:hypothetical protein